MPDEPTRNAAESRCVDPLGDAIAVLEHVRIEMPSARRDTEDAQNRVNLALEYLRMLRPGDAQDKAVINDDPRGLNQGTVLP